MGINLAELNLRQIGLTKYEINTINAILKLNEGTPPDISRIAQIPKTRIYDVLSKLEKDGFVIQVSDSPKKFRVHKIKESLKAKIDAKKRELEELAKQLDKINENYEEEKTNQLIKLKTERDLDRVLADELSKAKKNIIALADIKPTNKKIINVLKDLNNQDREIKIINSCQENYGLNAIYKPHDLHAFIIDDSKLLLGINKDSEYNLAVLNNQHLIEAFKTYFDKNWNSNYE